MTPDDVTGTVLTRFRAVAAALPDQIAVASPGAERTFAQVDAESDAIARALAGVAPDGAPVAMLLGHGVSGLVGLLGVMKSGHPVVPLDPLVPAARLEQIVRVAGARCCLTEARFADLANEMRPGLETIVQLETALSGPSVEGARPVPPGTLTDVAVIVFTSGSTGLPKGVAWTHGTLLNEAYAGAERLGFSQGDRLGLALPYTFAAGLTVFFFALLNGAGTYAYDPRSLGIRGLPDWIRSQALTTLHITPSLLRSLLSVLAPGQVLAGLRLVTSCGEPVHGEDIARLRPHLPPHCPCVNWCGASEIGSLAFFIMPSGSPLPPGPVPAGVPAAGKELALMREDGSHAALGETGEVVVISNFTAAGYWNGEPSLASRFGVGSDGRRTYRSGDLGRFDANGVLTLLGRQDAAVKIRGYLVEPAEVEAVLRACPGIGDAVVVAAVEPPASTRLVAYVVPSAHRKVLSAAALRRMLRAELPVWMVPGAIVWLPELPRNERGKVDRLALPPAPRRSQPFAEPRSEWELVLADLWTEVLQLDEISIHDDFIELGGDSLTATELLSIVSDKLGVILPSSTLVDAPTLAEFALKVANAQRSAPTHPTVISLRTTGSRPPLFCFAGAGGLGLGFLSLARQLGEEQPVYAFQAHGLERRGIPDWSVEQSAARHAQMIRVLAPRGPYLLAGHSLGGLIALEVAQQLKAGGGEVALVALLDTYLPGRARMNPRAHDPHVEGPNGNAPAAVGLQHLLSGVQDQVQRTFSYRLRPWWLRKMIRVPFTGIVQYAGDTQFDVFFNQGRVLERLYEPRPWDGRALVLRAEDNRDPEDGWSRWLTGPQRVCPIACVHLSMLTEPHVRKIAELLSAEIAQLTPSRAAPPASPRHTASATPAE